MTIPALLLMNEFLLTRAVRDVRDVSAALFLVHTVADYVTQSKRLVPEALTFLHHLLEAGFAPRRQSAASSSSQSLSSAHVSALPRTFPSPLHLWDVHSPKKVWAAVTRSAATRKSDWFALDLRWVLAADASVEALQESHVPWALYGCTLSAVERFATLYSTHINFPELFSPLAEILHRNALPKDSPSKLRVARERVLELLNKRITATERTRLPLVQLVRSKPLKMYNPVYNERFNPSKDMDPDKDRAALKQLTRKLKREKKAAMRELKRDTHFIATQQRAQAAQRQQLRDLKRKRLRKELERERKDTNVFRSKKLKS